MVRKEAVAGQFYPGQKTSLLREVESLIDSAARKVDAVGVVSPHAGYIYSGSVAGTVLSCISPKDVYVILGPNHTGIGETFGVDTNDSWRTPLGEVPVNDSLRKAILDGHGGLRADSLSHLHEHSIEVQLPFLQVLQEGFSFVPAVISSSDLDSYREAGTAIADAIKSLGLQNRVTLIASSDMTHYEPQDQARSKDKYAIEAVLSLDEKKLTQKVAEMDISMCGVAPTAVMLVAAKALGANHGRLVRYQTSGDTSGDYSSVVGYAGILIGR